ncbi:ammonia-forming cytochrome c nitrite reductase subunit c552 [Schaalia sp. 19OD2882]|uniref:ammonia-forming cytochrome c nitrite reductase subunit c552 n=1 Tax=Schaalia sp. 19OD2882 TaxID=2794089 RepID=UPI001C1ED46E|nr:ammonia-forming cytochrome c nitrite reductase subunit c552 [Schaalia sp. 19OD2882]QWW18897.1 ammonia-forming cytochrome c nitrite reductase subunit c552 [Schaalia sp. 19OD2882]
MATEKTTASGFFTKPLFLVLLIVLVAAGTFIVTMLLMNVNQHMNEAAAPKAQVVELTEQTYDPAEWGKNHPLQYEDYKKTAEFTKGSHDGVLEKQDATQSDPRTEVAGQKLVEDPRLKDMWAGYAFSKDYRHARGHEHMTTDQIYTLRNLQVKQPGTCANCHVSGPEMYDKLGGGDRQKGFLEMGKHTLTEVLTKSEAAHPVACIDCHDPKTMELRITRPGFERAIAALKKTQGVQDYDVNRDASTQEMRSYVCAQCHVEYYFKGEDKVLTFPWDKGIDIDDIYTYYEKAGFTDWEHKTTGAAMLKAQHPEFDVWSNSVHAANGVSCADCHMNFKRAGAEKITNHHITTPLSDVNASCGTCHKTGDGVLEQRVATIQSRYIDSRDRTFDALVALIKDLEKAKTDGTPADQIALAQQFQRKASFYLDYVYSENSYGFHAPEYIQRILSQALDAAREGQLALRGVPADQLKPSEISEHFKQAEEAAQSAAAEAVNAAH